MASSRKKVIVRRFSPGLLWGYLPQAALIQSGTERLALLDLDGRVHPVPIDDVKYVCYVRDFNASDGTNPERLLRKTFPGRPRTEGLWLRLSFKDGDRLEGLAALDLTFADGWAHDLGVHLTPPDTRGNTQRIYVPRASIVSMEVLAVITTPSRKKPVPTPIEEPQPDLFSMLLPPHSRPH